MTLYYLCVYHRDGSHHGDYQHGQPLTLTVNYWWNFPDRYSDLEIANWIFWRLNGLSSPLRTNAAGEFGFLAECVYKLMGYRPLSTGDVIELATGDDTRFLARHDEGWRVINEPSSTAGEQLNAAKVDAHLRRSRQAAR